MDKSIKLPSLCLAELSVCTTAALKLTSHIPQQDKGTAGHSVWQTRKEKKYCIEMLRNNR